MAKTTIKGDGHGLYVRTNGSVYRPQRARFSYTTAYHLRNGYGTQLANGQQVSVRHANQSPFAKVKTEAREELWCSHGQYLSRDGNRSSEDCWTPEPLGPGR